MKYTDAWKHRLAHLIQSSSDDAITTATLHQAILELWGMCCMRDEAITEFVFGELSLPKSIKSLSVKEKRGLYVFTMEHAFSGLANPHRIFLGEVVAIILLESENREMLNVYFDKLLAKKARLEHKRIQWERDHLWVQNVLAMFERRNPPLRLSQEEARLGPGQVHQ